MDEVGGGSSLAEALRQRAAVAGERLYCVSEGRALSVADIELESRLLAEAMSRHGVRPGFRVAVMLPNCVAHVVLVFALLRSSVVYVPINLRARGPGLSHILRQAQPELVVADMSVEDSIEAAAEEASWGGTLLLCNPASGPTGLCEAIDGLKSPLEPRPLEEGCRDLRGVAAISYTSGTTGPPKGVLITDRMLEACVSGVVTTTDPRTGDVYLVWEPLYHIGGLQTLFLPIVRDVSLSMVPRFSASNFWIEARNSGAHFVHYLGGVLQILLKQPPSAEDRDHNVRIAWGAGATAEIWRAFEDRFGVELREVYGLTETSSINTINRHGRVGSIGQSAPGFTVEVTRASPDATNGERGEIRLRATDHETITPGYFCDEEATSRLLPGDGWVYTGDYGRVDRDGNLYFEGRMTDSVRVRGENVSAWEVESALRAHPAIRDCAAIGVKAEIGEQEIKVFIERVDGARITEPELIRWCAKSLAPYQVPRYVTWVDAFLRGPSLRIVKESLPITTDDCWDRLKAVSSGDRRDSEPAEEVTPPRPAIGTNEERDGHR